MSSLKSNSHNHLNTNEKNFNSNNILTSPIKNYAKFSQKHYYSNSKLNLLDFDLEEEKNLKKWIRIRK